MPKENNTRCEHSVRLPQDTQQGFTGGIYGEAENPSAKPSLIQAELEGYYVIDSVRFAHRRLALRWAYGTT